MSRTSPWLVSLALALSPVTAGAQPRPSAIPSSNGDGLDTHLFRPALDSRGLISVNGVDVLPAGRISVGLTMDYGRGLLRVADVGQKSAALRHTILKTTQGRTGAPMGCDAATAHGVAPAPVP